MSSTRVRQLLHLLEDVRGEHDRPPLGGELLEQLLEVHALARVGAVERLVEDQDLRIVHERRREPHPLPHAARVGVHRAIAASPRSTSSIARSAAASSVDSAKRRSKLARTRARHEAVARLVLRHHADAPVERRVVAHRLAEHGDRAARRRGEAGHHAEQRRLAGAVGPEQTGDAGHDVEGHVAHRDDAPEPARHAVDANDRRRPPLPRCALMARASGSDREDRAGSCDVQAKNQPTRTMLRELGRGALDARVCSPKITSFTCSGMSVRLNIEIHWPALPLERLGQSAVNGVVMIRTARRGMTDA